MGDFGRVLAHLLAITAICVFMLANLLFDFQIESWPSWARVGLFWGAVALLTATFLLATVWWRRK
jgi:hypothetical protein